MCLGSLKAGTYTTESFIIPITYRVPAGWTNMEDTPGNFLLLPPGGDLPGVNAGTSDYIGVYASVAASAPACGHIQRDVPRTAERISAYIAHSPGIDSTDPKPVSLGGLKGIVLDLTLEKTWKFKCPGDADAGVTFITGSPPSDLEHAVIPGLAVRLYLLNRPGGDTLAVEIDDLTSRKHLSTYEPVVQTLKFKP
jgi:hypothetical protein